MDILDDMGVSKLSAKVFFLKWTTPLTKNLQDDPPNIPSTNVHGSATLKENAYTLNNAVLF